MKREEIGLIQESLEYILPKTLEVGRRLYDHLFALDPEIRSLFRTDMETQSRKLMSILVHICSNLDRMDQLEPELRELALKHDAYRVRATHYDLLGQALLQTLGEACDNRWTPPLQQAWTKAYQLVAESMIRSQRNGKKTG